MKLLQQVNKNKEKENGTNKKQEIYIPPEKRQRSIDDLGLTQDIKKKQIITDNGKRKNKPIRYNIW